MAVALGRVYAAITAMQTRIVQLESQLEVMKKQKRTHRELAELKSFSTPGKFSECKLGVSVQRFVKPFAQFEAGLDLVKELDTELQAQAAAEKQRELAVFHPGVDCA